MGTAAAVGAGANIVGGELQGWASVLDQIKMGQAYRSELAKQQAYQQQALGLFNQQPGKSSAEGMSASMAQAAKDRMGQYGQVASVPLGVGPTTEYGKQGYNPGAADAYTSMMGGLRAKDLAYGDYQVQQAIDNMRTQRQLDQISNFAGGQSRNVFPLQMYKAQHTMDWMSQLGQAISSIGGAAANYAQYAQTPQQQYGANPSGGPLYGPGLSGYSYAPAGTGYNPYTDQSTAPGVYPTYY